MLNGAFRVKSFLKTPSLSRCQPLTSLNRSVRNRNLLTLAIETSCDDTAVAILEKKVKTELQDQGSKTPISEAVLHFNEKITVQNTGLGGIHPIESLESHRANLSNLISRSLQFMPAAESGTPNAIKCENGALKRKPDFISVTRGPGMRSNVACGLDTAKGLSVAWQIPLLAVHHMQAHALTPRLVSTMNNKMNIAGERKGELKSETKPAFPFLTLLVSGGHTMLVHSTSLTEHKVMATTQDIAIGDALDKCGRLLLPKDIKDSMKDTAYAKHLSHYAFPTADLFESWPVPKRRHDEMEKPVNRYGWHLQTPLRNTRELSFSFTGMPSTLEKLWNARLEECEGQIEVEERVLFAQSALGIAFEHLGSRTMIALERLKNEDLDISALVVSGGVAANNFLRFYLRALLDARGFNEIELVFPPVELCTDNAAMIAWCGMEMYEAGFRSDLSVAALRKWNMDPAAADGGILGVGGWQQVDAHSI